MFLRNYFAKVICKVRSILNCLPSVCDVNDLPLSIVCKGASFGIRAKIKKPHIIYVFRNKINYLIKGTGYNMKLHHKNFNK